MAEDLADQTLTKYLKDVPQPLQDVIRDYIKDQLQPFLEDMRTRHTLSDENVSDLCTECLLVLCNVNSLEDMKDEIIAEVGLSYETAVRIHRALENEIQNKIMPEAEKRGFKTDIREPATSQPAPPSPSESMVADNRGVLYEDSGCRVTRSVVQIGGVSYPTRSIASVIVPLQLSIDIGGLLINGGLVLIGIIGVLSFAPLWMVLGVGASLLGGSNVRSEFRRPWWVTLKFNNGEERRIQRQDQDAIREVYAAIQKAIS